MRSLKVFVLIVIIMMPFFAVVALLLPSKVTVSKSILINATESGVIDEIEKFENWKNWYPAFQNQNIGVTISKKGDSSLMTLTDENQRTITMVMGRPEPGRVTVFLIEGNIKNVTWQFIPATVRTGETQLTWNINTAFPWYPWKKIRGIFLDKVTGPQYLEILQHLKIATEAHHTGSAG